MPATAVNSLNQAYPGNQNSIYPTVDPLRAVDNPQQTRFTNIDQIMVRANTTEEIPLAMRVVHLSDDMEAIGRLLSPAEALDAAHTRRDRTYDARPGLPKAGARRYSSCPGSRRGSEGSSAF